MTRNNADFFYQTGHQPASDGAPLHDLTGGGEFYPEDVYSPRGRHIYAGYDETARADWAKAVSYRNKPDSPVTIYRAVPKHVKDINPGDWVAISRAYAKEHGEGPLNGDYHILSKSVPAKHVKTPADSISEWGYFPNDSK
jgi:hypothetical protein